MEVVAFGLAAVFLFFFVEVVAFGPAALFSFFFP